MLFDCYDGRLISRVDHICSTITQALSKDFLFFQNRLSSNSLNLNRLNSLLEGSHSTLGWHEARVSQHSPIVWWLRWQRAKTEVSERKKRQFFNETLWRGKKEKKSYSWMRITFAAARIETFFRAKEHKKLLKAFIPDERWLISAFITFFVMQTNNSHRWRFINEKSFFVSRFPQQTHLFGFGERERKEGNRHKFDI